MAKQRKQNSHDFSAYYRDLFGQRWDALEPALRKPVSHFGLKEGLIREYYLDEASVLAARYLGAGSGQRVLDLCAAPGGKTLVIAADNLSAADSGNQSGGFPEITANERSASRRGRLKRVITEHLRSDIAAGIQITGHDAGRWGQFQPSKYDRVIADVPCSSERHVIQDEKYLKDWSPSRSRRLAQQAYSFAISALQTLRPGGILLYSTCALSPLENDNVIDRLLTRILKKADMSVITCNTREFQLADGQEEVLPDWVEESPLGFSVMPDRAGGRGPMYFSRIKKL